MSGCGTKRTSVQRYADKFDGEHPGMEPTDANLNRELAGCTVPPPHKLLDLIRREVVSLRRTAGDREARS